MESEKGILFSIVIPTYNRASLIEKTIQSILKQTYSHFEVIVVDDGSTDNTEVVLQKYLSVNFTYVKKQNGERAAARNHGSKLAKGDYINWFDSDDIMLPNHLSEANKMIQQYNYPEAFALGYRIEYDNGIIKKEYHYPVSVINKMMLHGNQLACNPVFLRRDIALQHFFNEDRQLSVSEDYELWLRIAARHPIYCSNVITSVLIEHDQRSMLSMNSKDKLIPRFEKLNAAALEDKEVVHYLGNRKNSFIAKNYLHLSSKLAIAGHKKEAWRYCLKAIGYSKAAIPSKYFLVTILNLLKKNRSL